jgi:transmembrane sensor
VNAQIYEEASEWLVDFRTGDVDLDARGRFEEWLSRSPEHVRAYLELVAVWEDVSRADAQRDVSVDALIDRARGTTNLISLESRARTKPPAVRPPTPRARRIAIAASVVIFVLAVGAAAIALKRYQHSVYTTDIGEQRSITLPDGSIVELNARSRISLDFSERERDVDLREGQALFRVAPNKGRPFVVTAGPTRVRAIGTQFDVDRKRTATIVTVLEGRVAIVGGTDETANPAATPAMSAITTASAGAAAPLELGAGEQVVVAPTKPTHPQPANLAAATAWTQRRLVFDSTPLSEVVEEFNRYNTRQLVIAGTGLENFQISGAFSSADPTPLLRFLRAQGNVRVTESRDRIVITRE